jgi:hypothetical protein
LIKVPALIVADSSQNFIRKEGQSSFFWKNECTSDLKIQKLFSERMRIGIIQK